MYTMMDTDTEELGAYIKGQLQRRGWSLRVLAERAGISPSTLSNLFRGKGQPGADTLQKVAGALEINEAHLLRLAGYLEDSPQGLHNADAIDLARQIEELPAPAQERAIRVIREILAFYTILDPPTSEE